MFRHLLANFYIFLYSFCNNLSKNSLAIKFLLKAAKLNSVYAQNELGVRYFNGNGVDCNYNRAVGYYKKAADRGCCYAQANIALCFYHGYGVTQNYKLSLEWYKRAAKAGHHESQYNLGLIYADNFKKANMLEAIRWLSIAEWNGVKEASSALDKLRQRL